MDQLVGTENSIDEVDTSFSFTKKKKPVDKNIEQVKPNWIIESKLFHALAYI